jgi:outer membrane protein assembly factor BamB
MQVVPAADGTLYAYRRMDAAADSLPALQKLPLSAPELVESSPSLTTDGAVVMGVRRSSVVALDRVDGRTVWTFSPEQGRRALLPVRSLPPARAPPSLRVR